MTDTGKFQMDPGREGRFHEATGIYVRAQDSTGKWGNADIAELDTESLKRFLTSRGGSNPWAENTVLILLGHDAS